MVNLVVWAVNEDVLLLGVSMHVDHGLDAALILREILRILVYEDLYHILDREDLAMQLLMRPLILTVEVTSGKGGAIVAANHAIRIDNGHDLKNELLSHLFRILVVARDKFEEPVHHERRVGLSRMHSRE
jgi:hypothetical protein